MAEKKHPDYNLVIFRDITVGHERLIRSTLKSKETKKWSDGKEYPLISVEVSDQSGGFYTSQTDLGKKKGRVKKYLDRYKHLKK